MGVKVDTTMINLNTIVIVVGFLITYTGIVAAWTTTQNNVVALRSWQDEHEDYHGNARADYTARFVAIDVRITDMIKKQAEYDNLSYRFALLEKSHEAMDLRINRIVESYSNQFTEMRTQLSGIATQVALVNQSLQRIEAGGKK